MIEARYDEKALTLVITGHAGSARYGKDLVCAAASILMLTLERALQNEGLLGMESEKQSGYARITCEEHGERAREIFETIFTGYALLAEEWPQYVKTERAEKRRGERHDGTGETFADKDRQDGRGGLHGDDGGAARGGKHAAGLHEQL